jgi:hypothetical protein
MTVWQLATSSTCASRRTAASPPHLGKPVVRLPAARGAGARHCIRVSAAENDMF